MTAGELIEELRKCDPDSVVQLEMSIGGRNYWSEASLVSPFERMAEGGFDFVIIRGTLE